MSACIYLTINTGLTAKRVITGMYARRTEGRRWHAVPYMASPYRTWPCTYHAWSIPYLVHTWSIPGPYHTWSRPGQSWTIPNLVNPGPYLTWSIPNLVKPGPYPLNLDKPGQTWSILYLTWSNMVNPVPNLVNPNLVIPGQS